MSEPKFKEQDKVKVAGEAGALFTVLAYRTNERGQVWYDLWGGRKGYGQFRSIAPGRIRRATAREVSKFIPDAVTITAGRRRRVA